MSIQESPALFDQMKICEGTVTIDRTLACAKIVCSAVDCDVSKIPQGEVIGKIASTGGDIREPIRHFARIELPEVCSRLQDCIGIPPAYRIPNALK